MAQGAAQRTPALQPPATNLLAISGSLRAGSSNAALLLAASRLAPPGIEIAVYQGLADLPHFNPDLDREGDPLPPAVAALRAQVTAADALIISSPEYAHGVPGSLKNALDWGPGIGAPRGGEPRRARQRQVKFRGDLFYRRNVFPIQIPPLRKYRARTAI